MVFLVRDGWMPKQDLAAQRSSRAQAHFTGSAPISMQSAAASKVVAPCAFVVMGNRGVPGSCFRMLSVSVRRGLGWRDGEGRARVPVPAADEQGQVHIPLCLRGESRLNAQKRMQGLVGAKTLADGFDAKDDAIQKNGQEANQG